MLQHNRSRGFLKAEYWAYALFHCHPVTEECRKVIKQTYSKKESPRKVFPLCCGTKIYSLKENANYFCTFRFVWLGLGFHYKPRIL